MTQVRQLEICDLEALVALYAYLNPDESLEVGSLRETWQWLCASEQHLYFGIDACSRDGVTGLVASCTATIVPNISRSGRPYGVIENVVTHAACRRSGYGRLVMQAAIDAAKNRHCYKIMLMSGMDRGHAHEFYTSLGFDKDAKQAFVIYCD